MEDMDATVDGLESGRSATGADILSTRCPRLAGPCPCTAGRGRQLKGVERCVGPFPTSDPARKKNARVKIEETQCSLNQARD